VTATNALAIRALAHPIRLDLLELLALQGPSTAAQCGRSLGVSQATCSFHLRQLAKFGFVEEAEPGPDRRERLWQVVPQQVTMDAATDPVVARELSLAVVDREAERIRTYLRRLSGEPADWREAAGGHACTVQVTVEEAAEIRRRWEEIIAPFEARTMTAGFQAGPCQRTVRYFLAATPVPLPATEQGEESR
jgi:predicted ArsR family transcriptional regulator